MKSLYLLRHAKSSWRDLSLGDHDRPLNKRGKKASGFMGKYIARNLTKPDLILCSTARRTRDTLTLLQEYLSPNIPVQYDENLYMASPPLLLQALHNLDGGIGTVMMISHNPGLEMLAAGLIGEGEPNTVRTLKMKYPTAALAVFTADISAWTELQGGTARLDSFIRPKDLGSP